MSLSLWVGGPGHEAECICLGIAERRNLWCSVLASVFLLCTFVVCEGKKGRGVLLHTMKTCERRDEAPLFLNLGTRWGRIIYCMSWPLYLVGKNPTTHLIGSQVSPITSLDILPLLVFESQIVQPVA